MSCCVCFLCLAINSLLALPGIGLDSWKLFMSGQDTVMISAVIRWIVGSRVLGATIDVWSKSQAITDVLIYKFYDFFGYYGYIPKLKNGVSFDCVRNTFYFRLEIESIKTDFQLTIRSFSKRSFHLTWVQAVTTSPMRYYT